VAKLFVPWQSSLCCSKALHAMAKDMPQHCMAFHTIVSLCLGKKWPAAVFHSMSHRAMALFFMPLPSSLCHSHVSLCHGKKQCTMESPDIQHHLSSFHSKKWHAAVFCGITHHGVAWCIVPWHCSPCCGHTMLLCYQETADWKLTLPKHLNINCDK